MKKQKFLALTLGIIATLLLGIGYAATGSIELTIGGDVTASNEAVADNFVVEFDVDGTVTTATKDDSTEITVTGSYTDATHATIDVDGLKSKGEWATATYTIENNSNGIGAAVVSANATSNEKYFKVTSTVANPTINEGDTTTVEVKVELIETPVEAEQTGTVTVTLTATPQANA